MDLLDDLQQEPLSGIDSGKPFETCVGCSTEVSQLDRLMELMRSDTGEDAPPDVIARVNQLFKSRAIKA
jgi:hypothetical protein